jgi:FkbM family methyltransferase
MVKSGIQFILQKLLGFETYLYVFARFKIATLTSDTKENDFIYFLKLLPHDAFLLDVGANIGIMTAHMSQHAKQGEVWAFEPIPENRKTLERVLKALKLKNVRVFGSALGNEKGDLTMMMPTINGVKKQGLSYVVHESIEGFAEGETFKVEVHTLNDLCSAPPKPIAGIKLDVENFEYFVLLGAQNVLKMYRPIVYTELWENENRSKCFELMQSLGYGIFVVNKGICEAYNPQTHRTQNFIFMPKSE